MPRLRHWRNEILYWKQEARQFSKLMRLGIAYGKGEDRDLLLSLEKELSNFLSEQIPPLEKEITPLEHARECEMMGGQVHEVETRIEELRASYCHLKMQLLPFLTKFVSTSIW
ncbi:MAG TPA: hypothetical protein PKC76_07785 [Saprospiraceae bacterium]|nr:hypothetical protein [Saprospiraceae bacterium]HMP24015.1 hypothetical protein [Saprospiraceae bacterium]